VVWWCGPALAWAIDGDYATAVATCGFAMQVGVNGALCQGAHIGGGLLVTAAHCVDEQSEHPALILFGDDLTNSTTAEYSFDDVECQRHATWDAQTQTGVDLAVCVIEDPLPDVPVVFPTPPDGFEVAYLREVLSDSTCEFQDWSCHDASLGSKSPPVPPSPTRRPEAGRSARPRA
jgi:secreted trypsin-like serine protease